jgi:fibronectin type 3 domain-containing protein
MPSINQRSFAGGEIAPALYARSDQAKYQSGLQTCENFIVMRHGGVANRPGTKFVCEVKTSSAKVRLIRFAFNAAQTYVLEFGNLYMRVIKNGVQLTVSGSPYEIVTPYVTADLATLNYVQSGDVITIVHPNYAPRVLARTGDTAWTLSAITYAPSISAPTGLALNHSAGTTTYYKVTSVKAETFEESEPTAEIGSNHTVTNSQPMVISWNTVSGAGEYNVYKKKNGVFGYIGYTTGLSFTDDGLIPDVTDTPPIPRDPFPSAGNYPSTTAFYQQRAVFAATNNAPEKVWLSRAGSYKNFTYRSPIQDDDAITFTIAGRQVNRVQHLVEVNQLLILTSGGEWLVLGDGDGAIRPTAINLRQQGYNGSSGMAPIVIANNALYVQARGSVVRDLRYDFGSDGYTGRDLTVFAPHLVDGYQLLAWDYQQIPHSVVWSVRDDGTLLGLTYVKEHEVWGWHRHVTDGVFEDVCCVSEGTEDAVYVVVNRTIGGVTKRFIERFARRHTSEVFDITTDAFFVDCGGTYNGTNATATTITATSYTGTTVQTIQTLTASSSTFIAGDVGNAFDLTIAGTKIRFTVLEYVSGTVVRVQPNKNLPASGFVGVASATWTRCVDEVTGLTWLVGKTVSILADGNVHPARVVDGTGKITLERPAGIVHAGLPYTSTFKTLQIDSPNAETLVDKDKLIHRVSLFVESSRGVWAGPDVDHLRELKQRRLEPYADPVDMTTGIVEVQTVAQWDRNGQIVVQQQDPLPITVLAVVPQVTVSGAK